MNVKMRIIQEVELPDHTMVRQVEETTPNGVVGYRVVSSKYFKTTRVGGLFQKLQSDRIFAKQTNINGAIQRI